MSDFRSNIKHLFDDSGFCKYGENCSRIYHKIVCERKKWDKKCNSRHSKPCKLRANCRLLPKAICAFKHEMMKRLCMISRGKVVHEKKKIKLN